MKYIILLRRLLGLDGGGGVLHGEPHRGRSDVQVRCYNSPIISEPYCDLTVSECSCQSSRTTSPPVAGRSPPCSPYRWGSASGQVILVLMNYLKLTLFDISVGQ